MSVFYEQRDVVFEVGTRNAPSDGRGGWDGIVDRSFARTTAWYAEKGPFDRFLIVEHVVDVCEGMIERKFNFPEEFSYEQGSEFAMRAIRVKDRHEAMRVAVERAADFFESSLRYAGIYLEEFSNLAGLPVRLPVTP